MTDVFTPHISAVDTRRGCVIVTSMHLGRAHQVVLSPAQARDLALRLVEQAARADPPPRLHGAEVTEFLPCGYPEEAAA